MSELTTCQQENESCDYRKLRAENEALREQLAAAQKDAEQHLSRIDKECLRIGREVQRAAAELPELYGVNINVERDAGWVTLTMPDMTEQDFPDVADGISYCVSAAIDAAIAQEKK